MQWVIREPVLEDAVQLGAIHVAAWQAAYRGGLMPDEYLAALDPAERARMWHEGLSQPVRERRARWVAEDESGRVRGFILIGPAGNGDDATSGEVFALNVHPDAWSTGAGTALMQSASAHFQKCGWMQGFLWVHPQNERAVRFYEKCGWGLDGEERVVELFGVHVPEARMVKTDEVD